MMTGKGIVVFSILLLASDVACDLAIPIPQNKAVANGATRVAFNCSSNNGWGFVGWSVLPVGGSTKSIASGSNVALPYRDTYEVSNAGDLTSILIIKTVNESLAGIYICGEAGAATASAQLIVYNSGPVCNTNVSSGQDLTQGQSVQMSCSFSYTASSSSVGVNMVWSNSSSPPVENTTVFPTDGRVVSTITPTVGYSSPFPVYKFQISFKVTGPNATNDPDYTNTTQLYSFPINVLYFNPSCSITGAKSGDNVYSGAPIICKANANPPPSYRWSNGTNVTLSNTDTVQITKDDQYTCTASNSVGRCTQSINLTVYTTTAPPTTTTITTITPPSTSSQPAPSVAGQSQPSGGLSDTNKIIVGVVVGVGGFLLILAIIIIICCCMKKNKSGAKYENGNQDITQMTSGAYKKMGTEGNLHQKQVSTNVSSAPQSNSAPKKSDEFSAVDTNKVANAKTNGDGLIYADLERETHPSVHSDKKPEESDKNPDQKITDNGTYADIREA